MVLENSTTPSGTTTTLPPNGSKNKTLNVLVFIWTIVTAIYTISVLGFLIPLPFGLLTLLAFGLLGFPVPVTLIYFPTAQTYLSQYSQISLNTTIFYLLMCINIVGVILSAIALLKIKKIWRWGYIFVVLSLIQFSLVISNMYLGICNINAGDGGTLSPGLIFNFVTSTVVLLIAFGILFTARREQQTFVADASPSNRRKSMNLASDIIFGVALLSFFLGLIYCLTIFTPPRASQQIPSASSQSLSVSPVATTTTNVATPTPTLPQPRDVSATVNKDGVNITWTGPNSYVGTYVVYLYDVYRSSASGFSPGSSSEIAQVSGFSLLDAVVRSQPGIYYYVIRIQNLRGDMGPASSQLKAVVPQY
jgi:hypothetical protein